MTPDKRKLCEHYTDLDLELRRFLESMDEEDVKLAKEILQRYRNLGVISRFMRWVLILAFTLFMGFAGAFEKIINLIKFWGTGK